MNNLAELFYPSTKSRPPQHMRQMYKQVARGLKNILADRFPGTDYYRPGYLYLGDEQYNFVQQITGIVSALGSSPSTLKLPDSSYRLPELLSLLDVLTESILDKERIINCIAPVCPDYSQGNTFYQQMGQGISSQANAALNAARTIHDISQNFGLSCSTQILVADTETDIPEIINRCVEGNTKLYQANCRASARAIREKGDEMGISGLDIATFTTGLGEDFHDTQYRYEENIRSLQQQDSDLSEYVSEVADNRRKRHATILGRPERDHELTIRYMAQYAALGSIVRDSDSPTILLNYPTDNLPFYNAATFVSPDIQLSEKDLTVVPIMMTVI